MHFMNSFSRFLLLILALSMLPLVMSAQEKGNAPKKRPDRARNEAWDSLPPEQREKLRQVLRDAWSDPAVISARDEVKRATEAYQGAIKTAVERADPNLSAALARLQRIEGRGSSATGGGRGGAFNRPISDSSKLSGLLSGFSPEIKERIHKAEETAQKADAVVVAKEAIRRIQEEDEAIRRKRVEAFRELRRATIEEIVRADPSLAEVKTRFLEGEKRDRSDAAKHPKKDQTKVNVSKATDSDTSDEQLKKAETSKEKSEK